MDDEEYGVKVVSLEQGEEGVKEGRDMGVARYEEMGYVER
jgi:hypothetical protein